MSDKEHHIHIGLGASSLDRLALATAIVALLCSLTFAIWATREVTGNDPAAGYFIESPIQILNIVPDAQVPTAYINDDWESFVYRCLDLDVPVEIRYSLTFFSEANELVTGEGGNVVVENNGGSGCEGSTEAPIVALTSTPPLTEGMWRYTSSLEVYTFEGDLIETTATSSEWVQIIEAPPGTPRNASVPK